MAGVVVKADDSRAVAPAFVVLTLDDDGATARRRVFLSLHNAVKAAERAQKAGRRFDIVLCQLVPVPGSAALVVGGEDE
ncbi:hypothetical protein [Nocardioides sp.]|uniref:hypothetical protein n=1 Tax=Nocardioides sp. TaxID=35761 RepID=UPI0035197BDD